jgi:hypothetical protein
MITEDKLNEVELRCSSTQLGPWTSFIENRDHESGDSFIRTGGEDMYLVGGTIADHDFIANAKQDIPDLIAEIRRLRKLLL